MYETIARKVARSQKCPLAGARFLIAQTHGFATWRALVRHVDALADPRKPAAQFEAAADAIIDGNEAALAALVRRNSRLVRSRSLRIHHATLLHYVSANGVEGFRQRTPPNIVAIATALLDAGADVDVEADVYGGGATTLGLAATSAHPEHAGVQLDLMQLLIDRGASIDGSGRGIVVACLANGRREAAEFLAARGARLDLEAAAGVGRLDVVTAFVRRDGRLARGATRAQLNAGFMWACEYGRTAVVRFLLQAGFDPATPQNPESNGQRLGITGLHWAGLGGHADIAKLLLEHGAPVNAVEPTDGGNPLHWTLYGWNPPDGVTKPQYYDVVSLLVSAGATLGENWFETGSEERRPIARKAKADPRMVAALNGDWR